MHHSFFISCGLLWGSKPALVILNLNKFIATAHHKLGIFIWIFVIRHFFFSVYVERIDLRGVTAKTDKTTEYILEVS